MQTKNDVIQGAG